MRGLLRFLLKHHFTLLFLLLEIIAILLLLRFNSYHNARIFKIRHAVIGNISEKFTNYSRYLTLDEQNKELIEENARLYNQLQTSYYHVGDESFSDSLWLPHYKFIPAEVVNNSVNKQYNYITLNKGRIHGIEEDMGVICSNGIVGMVNKVNKYYSSVIPVLNRDFFPNARIKTTNFTGIIEWTGKNYRYVNLKDIPLHAVINIGDTVETSGYTKSFPEGILIGTVTDYEVEKGVSYKIEVELSTDFKRLNNVWIIENLLKNYQEQLEDSVRND